MDEDNADRAETGLAGARIKSYDFVREIAELPLGLQDEGRCLEMYTEFRRRALEIINEGLART